MYFVDLLTWTSFVSALIAQLVIVAVAVLGLLAARARRTNTNTATGCHEDAALRTGKGQRNG